MSDNYGWIEEELKFTGKIIDQEIPILGICFGHQLLGKFFGVSIERYAMKSGLIKLELMKEDKLFKGIKNLISFCCG